MTTCLHEVVVALTIAASGGCGARSELAYAGAERASDGTGGGGGEPAATSSSGGGGAGSGGGPGGGGTGGVSRCVVDGPVLELAGAGDFATFQPALVATGTDGGQATLVTSWQLGGNPDAPVEIRHTTFDPWNAWPDEGTIEPSYLADFDGGQSMVAGRDGENLSVVFANQQAPPSGAPNLAFLPNLAPGSGGVPESVALAGSDARPGFADGKDGYEHLMGFAETGAWPDVVKLSLVKETLQGLYLQDTLTVGCATEPTRQAGAVVEPGAWIVALSTSGPLGSGACESGMGDVGPPDRIVVARVESSGFVVSPGADFPLEAQLETLHVVPRSDGAWIIWTTGQDVRLARVGVAARQTTEPTGGPINPDLGAAPFRDDGFAWAYPVAGSRPQISLTVNDGEFANGSLDLDVPGEGPMSLLTRPPDGRVVVAWTEKSIPVRVRVARFDCGP